jgi:hypothetical protein
MKAELIKQLHALGVYRDPKTKQKLEGMKVADVLGVMNYVEEEMKNGVKFERKQCEYEFVKVQSKAEKLAAKAGKGKRK